MAPTAIKIPGNGRAKKQQRLEARVTASQKRLIERAAKLRGTSVTAFVVVSAQEAAARTIADSETLSLQAAASEVFVNAVLSAPAPNAAARSAARRYLADLGR
jgi:uncharacterized protein (DUF1778 family)